MAADHKILRSFLLSLFYFFIFTAAALYTVFQHGAAAAFFKSSGHTISSVVVLPIISAIQSAVLFMTSSRAAKANAFSRKPLTFA